MTVRTIDAAGRPNLDSQPTQRRLSRSARLVAAAERGWRAYWQRRARRATLLLLSSLDERTLHDIGLSPSEIQSAVYGGPDRIRVYEQRCPAVAERAASKSLL